MTAENSGSNIASIVERAQADSDKIRSAAARAVQLSTLPLAAGIWATRKVASNTVGRFIDRGEQQTERLKSFAPAREMEMAARTWSRGVDEQDLELLILSLEGVTSESARKRYLRVVLNEAGRILELDDNRRDPDKTMPLMNEDRQLEFKGFMERWRKPDDTLDYLEVIEARRPSLVLHYPEHWLPRPDPPPAPELPFAEATG